MSFDTTQIDHLEGSSNERGGLIIKKKTPCDNDDFVFKKPKVSLLGLDKLAQSKQIEKKKKEENSSTFTFFFFLFLTSNLSHQQISSHTYVSKLFLH